MMGYPPRFRCARGFAPSRAEQTIRPAGHTDRARGRWGSIHCRSCVKSAPHTHMQTALAPSVNHCRHCYPGRRARVQRPRDGRDDPGWPAAGCGAWRGVVIERWEHASERRGLSPHARGSGHNGPFCGLSVRNGPNRGREHCKTPEPNRPPIAPITRPILTASGMHRWPTDSKAQRMNQTNLRGESVRSRGHASRWTTRDTYSSSFA